MEIPRCVKGITLSVLVAFTLVFIVLNIVTVFENNMLSIESLYIKHQMNSDPCFTIPLFDGGYEVQEIDWFTAKKIGDNQYRYYIVVILKSDNTLSSKVEAWDRWTNGYVYYDSNKHECQFDLVGIALR